MEVELKLKLPGSLSHQKLTTLLSPHHVATHLQENFFFDTPTLHLSSLNSALRIRFGNLDSHATLTFKSNPNITLGISHAQELEHSIDPTFASSCIEEPQRLFLLHEASEVVRRVKECVGEQGLVCLGGFKNVRRVYEWKGLKLEVDETEFGFETRYEVECECQCVEGVERAKEMIEEFFRDNGIEFEYSKVSKFDVFRANKLS